MSEQAELGAEEQHQGELAQHMLAHLLCTQRHTVTGLLNTLGRQQQDWTKAYRLYREHVDGVAIFSPVLDGVLELLPQDSALVISVEEFFFPDETTTISTVMAHGPASPEVGAPAVIASEDDGGRGIFATFAFYRLPAEVQTLFAQNAVTWLMGE